MNILTMRVSMESPRQLSYVLLSMDPSERINQPNFKLNLPDSFATVAANARERVGRALQANSELQMLGVGAELAAAVMPDGLREQLLKSTAEMLYLDLEEDLIHFPWECIRLDDHTWLGSRFVVGRHVRVSDGKDPSVHHTNKKFVIIADPDGTLATARAEGTALLGTLGKRQTVTFLGSRVSKAEVCEQMRDCAFLHYAGHSSEQGLHCADGILSAADIFELGLAPRMAFLNSCDSGHTLDGGSSRAGVVQALLGNGSLAIICTNSLIHSETAAAVSDKFYGSFMSGECLGQSIAKAVNSQPGGLEWARYTIYGNPLYDGKSLRRKVPKRALGVALVMVALLLFAGLASTFFVQRNTELEDFSTEEKILHSACRSSATGACIRLGESLRKRGRDIIAFKILEYGCDKGERASCSKLAVEYLKVGELEKAKARGKQGCAEREFHCVEYSLTLSKFKLDDEANALSESLCEAKHAIACAQSARIKEARGEKGAARRLLSAACDMEYKLSCARLALNDVRDSKDEKQLRLLKSYCDGNVIEGACEDYGSALVLMDRYDEAVVAFEKACAFDSTLRFLYCEQAGMELIVQRPEKAKAFLDIACKGGKISACATLAEESSAEKDGLCHGENLSDCREYAFQIQKKGDLVKAAKIYEYICAQGGQAACNDAGVLAIGRNETEAAEKLYKMGCEKNDSFSCLNLAGVMVNKGDKAGGIEIVRAACDRGNADACYRAAQLNWVDPPTEVNLGFLRRACDLGNVASCSDFGFYHRHDSDKALTISSYKKACAGGNIRGCLNIGYFYKGKANYAEASGWFAQACNLGDGEGCDMKQITDAWILVAAKKHTEALAIMVKFCNDSRGGACKDFGKLKLEMGDSVAASKAFLRSCHAGSEESCTLYGEQEMTQGRLDVAAEFCGKACKSGDKDGCACEARAKGKR